MCAQYLLKLENATPAIVKSRIRIQSQLLDQTLRILPHSMAPILLEDNGDLVLRDSRFSLLPSWSKEPKVKFATHNARIESVLEKPTWKRPFVAQHALIPMGGFIESVYEGPYQGNLIVFRPQDENKSDEKVEQVIWAAGLFDEWLNPQTGEVINSFSILTSEPNAFIAANGHDRSPIFLPEEKMLNWLPAKQKTGEIWRDWLLKEKYEPELKIEIDRPLKSGWEKRK